MKILADVMTAIGEIGFEQQQQQEYVDDAQLMEELAQKRVRAMGRIAIMMKKMRLEREANIKRLETKSANSLTRCSSAHANALCSRRQVRSGTQHGSQEREAPDRCSEAPQDLLNETLA